MQVTFDWIELGILTTATSDFFTLKGQECTFRDFLLMTDLQNCSRKPWTPLSPGFSPLKI